MKKKVKMSFGYTKLLFNERKNIEIDSCAI